MISPAPAATGVPDVVRRTAIFLLMGSMDVSVGARKVAVREPTVAES